MAKKSFRSIFLLGSLPNLYIETWAHYLTSFRLSDSPHHTNKNIINIFIKLQKVRCNFVITLLITTMIK